MSQNYSPINLPPTDFEHDRLAQSAQRYLDNPVLMNQLCDRVYERLHAELKLQKERIGNSNSGRQ
ncbi:hypothetical protein KBT16_03685 [Nostoc sp. CCCryo 231-06]|nr:hypothetical protein [Nostoc sp. CCCryo 231-06]